MRKSSLSFVSCLGLLSIAGTCFAQMYAVTDLGTLGEGAFATGLNASGQVVGGSHDVNGARHAFRTAPNSPINPATDDLGTLGGAHSQALGINASGQVVGWSYTSNGARHAFRTAANSPINPAADDLGALAGGESVAYAISDHGVAVGASVDADLFSRAFAVPPAGTIGPGSDLGTLGGQRSAAYGINDFGKVVGWSETHNQGIRAFRKFGSNLMENLGTLGGTISVALAINASGQAVGYSFTGAGGLYRAFRTGASRPIDAATDDLGTLGGPLSSGNSINAFGQVVGWAHTSSFAPHAFLFSGDVMHDLNSLIPADSGWELFEAVAINDAGQIAGNGLRHGEQAAFLLTPVYRALVQPPLYMERLNYFRGRAVIPVKFSLTEYDLPTCNLPPATISVSRTVVGRAPEVEPVDESAYVTPASGGSDFRVDFTDCQYQYTLAAASLGPGEYRVDISINGIPVGHAGFLIFNTR